MLDVLESGRFKQKQPDVPQTELPKQCRRVEVADLLGVADQERWLPGNHVLGHQTPHHPGGRETLGHTEHQHQAAVSEQSATRK